MKKIISAALVILLMASNALAVNLYVDGRELKPDVPPALVSGRTLVPVRVILESLGAAVSWNDATQTAIATKAGTTIAITLNSKTAFVNGQAKTLDVPAMTINGRTMVPARFVAETLNADITWEDDTETVYIATVDCYDGYRCTPDIIYTTPAEENGFGDVYMYVDGSVQKVYKEKDYSVCDVKTSKGTIALMGLPFVSELEGLTVGKNYRFCYKYLGYSDVLSKPAGLYIELGDTSTINESNVTSSTKSAEIVTTSPEEKKPVSTSHKIYCTKSGKRYHYDPHCNGGTYYECSLQDALNVGLTPCSKCVN